MSIIGHIKRNYKEELEAYDDFIASLDMAKDS